MPKRATVISGHAECIFGERSISIDKGRVCMTQNSRVLEPCFVCAAVDGTHLTMGQQM